MTAVDDTFTRIIFGYDREEPDGPRYYRHTEHGGPTRVPLEADWSADFGSEFYHLLQVYERDARCPLVPLRLIVSVQPFSTDKAVLVEMARSQFKRKAARKLTELERAALGIDENGERK